MKSNNKKTTKLKLEKIEISKLNREQYFKILGGGNSDKDNGCRTWGAHDPFC